MAQYKCSNGTWEYRCHYTDIKGKDHVKHVRGFKTKKEAKIAEMEFLKIRSIDKNSRFTFEELYQEYLEDKKTTMKASSIVSISNKIETHILPYFKSKIVKELSVNDVRKWQNHLLSQGYSIKYLQGIHTRLSSILEFACKYYQIPNNVAKIQGNFKSEVKERKMDFYSYEEWKKFESVIDDDDWKCFFQFLYWTGCRRGEVQALTWNDIDNFEIASINKSCSQKVSGKSYEILVPKTQSSIRDITIPKTLKRSLESKYSRDKDIMGFNNDCFIFGVTKPLSDETIRRKKNQYCKLANLRQIRIHDFRHSHASFLFGNGLDISLVSKRLGHDNISTTMQVYIHMLPKQEDLALKIMNKFD